jgi:NAD(P)-dependent dehydrogenase (short-subunit alcohol dehydrogenase family)
MELRGRSGIVLGAESPIGAAIVRALEGAGAQVRAARVEGTVLAALAGEVGDRSMPVDEVLGADETPGFLIEATPLPAFPATLGETAGLEEALALAARPMAQAADLAMRMKAGGAVVCVSAALGPTLQGGWLPPLLAWRAAAVAGLARELAPRGVRVNGLAPVLDGAAKLPGFLKRGGPKSAPPTPLGRAADPGEVAEAALWLLRAGMVSGLTLPLDGGRGL